MSDPLENLFDETLAPEAEAPAPVEAQPAPQDHAPEAVSTGEPATPPVATDDSAQRIPITALLDEREKRQAAERRAQEIERRLAEFEAQRQQQPAPDFFENPEAAFQRQQQMFQSELLRTKVQLSAEWARKQHGEETVQRVVEFFNDPRHAPKSHEFIMAPDPFGAALAYYNQQQLLSEIGTDPNAYKERLRQQLLAELQSQQAQPAPVQAKPTPPPRSIASQPGAASPKATIPVDPLFD